MVSLVENNLDAIKTLCKQNYVEKLYLFGSAARGTDFSESSDVDFLCYYQPYKSEAELFARHDYWYDLEDGLEKLLGRKVDVVPGSQIRNKYLIHFINQDKVLVYAS